MAVLRSVHVSRFSDTAEVSEHSLYRSIEFIQFLAIAECGRRRDEVLLRRESVGPQPANLRPRSSLPWDSRFSFGRQVDHPVREFRASLIEMSPEGFDGAPPIPRANRPSLANRFSWP